MEWVQTWQKKSSRKVFPARIRPVHHLVVVLVLLGDLGRENHVVRGEGQILDGLDVAQTKSASEASP